MNEETGYQSYGARVGAHDDAVLSIALACWYATQGERNAVYDSVYEI